MPSSYDYGSSFYSTNAIIIEGVIKTEMESLAGEQAAQVMEFL